MSSIFQFGQANPSFYEAKRFTFTFNPTPASFKFNTKVVHSETTLELPVKATSEKVYGKTENIVQDNKENIDPRTGLSAVKLQNNSEFKTKRGGLTKRALSSSIFGGTMVGTIFGGPLVDVSKVLDEAKNRGKDILLGSYNGQRIFGFGWGGDSFPENKEEQKNIAKIKRVQMNRSKEEEIAIYKRLQEVPVAVKSFVSSSTAVRKPFQPVLDAENKNKVTSKTLKVQLNAKNVQCDVKQNVNKAVNTKTSVKVTNNSNVPFRSMAKFR